VNSKVHLALSGIRISLIIYYLIMVGSLLLAVLATGESEQETRFVFGFLFVFLVAFAVFLEALIVSLRKRKFWSWVAGLIVGALYVPSLFLPMGIMILVGLLAEGSRNEFGLGKK
jgi:hypothetical protein